MAGKIDKISLGTDKHTSDATCILFYNDHVFSGGADGKIKIWDRDLILLREIDAHESYIYTMCINCKGRLYSSSADGTIRYFENLLNSNVSEILMKTEYDEIGSLACDNEILYSGDDKGVVIKWVDNKITFKYNLVEEVRSLAVENNYIYTARDLDAVITDLGVSKTGQYVTIGTIPGRAPLALIGPIIKTPTVAAAAAAASAAPKSSDATNGDGNYCYRRKYLVFITRDGKGIVLLKNERKFPMVWTKENAHDMIINSICGSDTVLYTAGYDGKVKKWVELENSPQEAGEATLGHCINSICMGPDDTVYVADTRGMISRACFGIKAG